MPKRHRHHRQDNYREIDTPVNNSGLDLSSIANIINSIDLNELTTFVNNLGNSAQAEQGNVEVSQSSIEEQENNEIDEKTLRRNEIVKSINTLINADKSELVQIIIQIYAASKAAKK